MKQAAGSISSPELESLVGNGFEAPPKQRCSNPKTKAAVALAFVVAVGLCTVIAVWRRGGLHLSVPTPVIQMDEQASYLAYSWRINSDQPFLVEPSKVIFDFTPGEVWKRTFSKADSQIITSESSREFATEVSTHLGIEGSYGWGPNAFEAAAEASLSSVSRSQYKQFRLDKMITAEVLRISHAHFDLWPKLSPQAKSFLLEKTPKQIHMTFGDFYATQASLGGIFQQTVTMQQRKSDNKFSLEASIKASFNSLAGSAAASLSGSTSVGAKVNNRNANVMLKVLGGKADVWLQLNADNQKEIQSKWAESVTTENMFPITMRLVPLWALLEHKDANPTKAEELRAYMKDQWLKSNAKLPKYDYAPEASNPTCPSCKNMAGMISHEGCQDLAKGFRLTANHGLTYKGYGLDDDSQYTSSSYRTKSCHFYAEAFVKNTCYLAAFGEGGTVRHSLTSSSQKVGSGRKMQHWDCRSFGKTEFRKNDKVNWNFNTQSGDTDYPVTQLECQFEC